jgi:hypothetical protein
MTVLPDAVSPPALTTEARYELDRLLRAELGDPADEAADGFHCAGCRQRVCFQEAGLEEASRLCRDCGDELSGAGDADAARPEWKPGTEIPRRLLAIPDENPPGMPRPLLPGGQPLPWAEYPLGQREGDHLIAYDDDSCAYLEPVQLQVPERLYEAFYERLCVLCGEPLGDPVFFFADLGDGLVAQGGLHRRCARFTRAHCPAVPSRDLLAVPAALWEELVATADHPDKYSAIRPEREWLERAYERAVDDPDSVLLGDPEPLPGDSD